jgi:hypothetical protein
MGVVLDGLFEKVVKLAAGRTCPVCSSSGDTSLRDLLEGLGGVSGDPIFCPSFANPRAMI